MFRKRYYYRGAIYAKNYQYDDNFIGGYALCGRRFHYVECEPSAHVVCKALLKGRNKKCTSKMRCKMTLLEDMLPAVADSTTWNANLRHTLCARLSLKGRYKKCTSKMRCIFYGAPWRIRTFDLPVRSRALYPLS